MAKQLLFPELPKPVDDGTNKPNERLNELAAKVFSVPNAVIDKRRRMEDAPRGQKAIHLIKAMATQESQAGKTRRANLEFLYICDHGFIDSEGKPCRIGIVDSLSTRTRSLFGAHTSQSLGFCALNPTQR